MRESDQIKDQFIAGLDGDRASYERVLRTLAELVRVYVRRRLSSSYSDSDVEDVVQTILIAIHDKRATYERVRPLLPWVYGISKYKLLQFLRADGRRRAVVADVDLDDLPESYQVAPMDQTAAGLDVSTMLDTLSEEQKEALQLTKLQGLSVQDAAQHAGVSLSAMKVRVHRALKRLQKMAGGR